MHIYPDICTQSNNLKPMTVQSDDFFDFKITPRINRIPTNEVVVGNISIGSGNPIRIQSMTNTPLQNVASTVNQVNSLWLAGAEMVRLAVPTIKDVASLSDVKNNLKKINCHVPLIADVHFNPAIAEAVVPYVSKVRINPGNYIDKKTIGGRNYSDEEFNQELEKIAEKLKKLVDVCKQHGTAIRIGVNHGSLSDRILHRFGNTTKGMVESAMEYIRFCEAFGFKNIVLSMKASNPLLMIEANRLLVSEMQQQGIIYPLHLGVTEAGNADEGRIKSSLGIGTLLEEGIGDTIRVSLAEDPLAEIPVAKKIASIYNPHFTAEVSQQRDKILIENYYDISIPAMHHPLAISDLTGEYDGDVNHMVQELLSKPKLRRPDYILADNYNEKYNWDKFRFIVPFKVWKRKSELLNVFPLFYPEDFKHANDETPAIKFLLIDKDSVNNVKLLEKEVLQNSVLLLHTDREPFSTYRKMIAVLHENNIRNPLVLWVYYMENDYENLVLRASTDAGGILVDKLADGLCVSAHTFNNKGYAITELNELCFNILQASGRKITKTEFIICPSCSRTLYDYEKLAEEVKLKTSHLTGLKIAVMGCIVNGLGEMGDADYGFVGFGKDLVALYRNKEMIKKNIEIKHATNELIELIKSDGKWQ
jgi:(E)-4-hydroxy-3-methylbut-2-enyl-diphosphate synthase